VEKLPAGEPEWARWAELVVAARASERPALAKQALAVLDVMAGQSGNKKQTLAETDARSTTWEKRVKNIRARAVVLARGGPSDTAPTEAFGADPAAAHWARVTQTNAESRGTGKPVPHWSYSDGEFTHHPGHNLDMMYLAVPVRGEFQLDCELTGSAGRQIHVMYNAQGVAPESDLKHLDRFKLGSPTTGLTVNPPIEKLAEWYRFQLAVKGGRMTALLNGRKVYEAPAPAQGDAWLAFLCRAAESGAVRKIAISGDPQIPEKLELSAVPELTGWLAADYDERTAGENPDWEKRGDEIFGRASPDLKDRNLESLLRYHRPMLEDGRIAYEFYFDPGSVMVHPALDRLAFLIAPDGVKIHRLTDGAYERSGLAADQTQDEPENRRGPASLPLKANAWNQAALSVSGDRVVLELNGQRIYERAIEPVNQRTFGLFHYADLTEVRVRNVTYQGNWPRSLPAGLRPQPK
jgi:hypothetical protein